MRVCVDINESRAVSSECDEGAREDISRADDRRAGEQARCSIRRSRHNRPPGGTDIARAQTALEAVLLMQAE